MHDFQLRVDRLRSTIVPTLRRVREAVSGHLSTWPAQLASLRTRVGWQALWRSALPVLGFAAAYLAAYVYGNGLPSPAPLWPPDAILLSALLLTPPRRWWIFLLISIPIRMLPALAPGVPTSLLIVNWLNDTLKILLAAVLVRRFAPRPLNFTTLRAMGIYLASAVLVAPVLSAFVGAADLATLGTPYWQAWRTWFLGDALAGLVLTPTIVMWATVDLRPLWRRRTAEALLLGAALLVVGGLLIVSRVGLVIDDALYYLPFPLLVWAAVRLGPRGIASALTVVTCFAIASVVGLRGLVMTNSTPQEVLSLQLFLIATAVPLLLLAAQIEERKQAVEAVRASEARFRAAFASAATGMMLVDPTGHFLQVNPPLVEMLGYSEAELRTHTFMQLTYPDDLESNLALLQQALSSEIDSYQTEQRFLHKGGDLVWGRVSAGVVRDAAGQPLYLVSQLEDITAWKRLEQEREAARAEAERHAEQLDRLFEAVADGIAVYDRDGRELRTNAALQRLLKLDVAPPEYAHMSLHERMMLFAARDGHGRLLTPDEGPLPRALAGEVMAGANAMDLRSRTFDGRELELNVSAAPLRDGAGQLVGVVCIFRDQTEGKRLEREVAEQAEQLDRIVEGMGEGLFVYDMQGQVVRTNAAARRLLGAALPDFSQLSAEERLAVDAPRERQESQMPTPEEWLAAHALVGNGDVRLQTLDGRELEVSASVAPLHNPAGQVVGAVLLLSDRTERNQLVREREEARASELALREINQQLDTFVAVAAHDLRQPVTAAKLVIAQAQRQVHRAAAKVQQATTEQMVPFTQVETALVAAQHNLDRLWQLLQQLLDVTRARQGILTLSRQPCRLEALVRAGVEEQRMLTPSSTLTLDLPEPGGLPIMVDADAERLSQVLTNYLANAVRYTPNDQPIEVTLRVVEQAPEDGGGAVVRVAVRDHGPGIAPEEHTTIWDRFQRAHNTSDAGGGLGLGLYIARTIVLLHGGRVGVESTVGEGATFWFTLSLAPVEAGDAELAGVLSTEPSLHDDVLP